MATANLKHTWTITIKNDSGAAVVADPPLILTGDAETNFSTIVAPATSTDIVAPITVSKIVSGFMSSNQPVTVVAGGVTYNVAKDTSITWNNTQTSPSPFTADISDFNITNSGSAVATVRGGFLLQE